MRPLHHLAGVAALLALGSPAWAATKAEDRIERAAKTLGDLAQPDTERTRARDYLLQAGGPGVDRLIELGKTATNDNVRMQVAIALANVRSDRPTPEATQQLRAKVAANLDLLAGWLENKDADPALRYWAARAIAFPENADALETLKKTLSTLKATPEDVKTSRAAQYSILRTAITRSLGAWESNGLAQSTVEVLTELLKDKDPDARIAAIDGLRGTQRNRRDVVEPLFAVAKGDPMEPVWRAAVEALRGITRMRDYILPAGATADERKNKLLEWEDEWLRRTKQEEATKEKAKGGENR